MTTRMRQYLDQRKAECAVRPAVPVPDPPAGRIVYRCGHQAAAIDCPTCIDLRRQYRRAKEAQAKADSTPTVPRLPAGSVKRLTWNGSQWVGTLDVPGAPQFQATGDAEKHCFHALDAAYRLWLKGRE